jgi:hypothetical protein
VKALRPSPTSGGSFSASEGPRRAEPAVLYLYMSPLKKLFDRTGIASLVLIGIFYLESVTLRLASVEYFP